MKISDVKASISAGDLDPFLAELIMAITERVESPEGPVLRWRVSFDGAEMTEEDMTVSEASQLEELTGNTWLTLNPVSSAAMAAAFLTVTLMRKPGVTLGQAKKQVEALPAAEVLSYVERYQGSSPTDPAG